MESVKEIIAKNLLELRKTHKLTQQELAEKLNYSDKAISRWEHAETLPDIETLCRVCDLYGVRFEYLLQREQPKANNPYIKKKDMPNRIIVTLIALATVWIAVTLSYTYINLILDENKWTLFIWAIPITAFVCLIFNSFLFKNRILKYISISVINWTFILSVYIELLKAYNAWLLFIIGIPVQILIILLAILKLRK